MKVERKGFSIVAESGTHKAGTYGGKWGIRAGCRCDWKSRQIWKGDVPGKNAARLSAERHVQNGGGKQVAAGAHSRGDLQEITTIQACIQAFEDCPEEARDRVVMYLVSRYGADA